MTERGFGHIPGQGWHGGYGGDRDLSGYDARPNHDHIGRGFTGNDFGGGHFAPPQPRHFGTEVDRGGRMSPESYGSAGYGRSPYAAGYPPGHGYHPGSDMGMGAPDEDRGPHYGKGPKGYKRSDERTREEVCDAIAHQGRIDASDVEVTVESGIVTLSGTVSQRPEKRMLEHLAESCRGVHEVHNELRLRRAEAPKAAAAPRPEERGQTAPNQSGQGDGGTPKNGKTARA